MKEILLHKDVVVISDVHVGDPCSPNLDEFRGDLSFEKLLLDVIPNTIGWPATLIINGDFIDFPQVKPELSMHTLGPQFGTPEIHSFERFLAVTKGHPKVFSSLKTFLEDGGQVIILAGNHDIDLHWPSVFKEFTSCLGGACEPQLMFCNKGHILEQGIYIEHGNQYAFDNKFMCWENPILISPDGPRLERPWGTFFMDIVYNDIEQSFPLLYKDAPALEREALIKNHKAMRKMARALYPHYYSIIVYLRSIASQTPLAVALVGKLVGFLFRHGKMFLGNWLLGDDKTNVGLEDFIDSVLPHWSIEERHQVTEFVRSDYPGVREQADLLSTNKLAHPNLLGNTINSGLSARALDLVLSGQAQLVVFGHTHEAIDGNRNPILGKKNPARMFNTGSWIPRLAVDNPFDIPSVVDLSKVPLREEVKFLVIRLGSSCDAELRDLPADIV